MVKGLCWHLPLEKLLGKFSERAREHQLLIVQPNSAAMVYARNQKPGCFTGFVQTGPADREFNYLDFITKQALPGPGSNVHCIIQHHGSSGPTSFITLEKTTPLAQIPALKYTKEVISPLPRPSSWTDRPMVPEAIHSVKLVQRGLAEYQPRAPETESQIMDSMLGPLLPVYLSCISNQVTAVSHFSKAPEHLQRLVKDPRYWPTVIKYIAWRRDNWSKLDPHGVPRQQVTLQIYADEEEQQAMAACHPRCLELLQEFLDSIETRSFVRALDVAGGDGRLAASAVFRPYQHVDLLEQCPIAVAKAQQLLKQQSNFGFIALDSMQDFHWPFSYSAVFMVWCTGYLGREQLIAFLRKA